MKFKTTPYAMLLLACALIASAHADIKYTQTTTMGDGSGQTASFEIRESHFVAPGKECNETEMNMGNFKSKEALITLCASKQIIHIDDALKIDAITDTSYNTPAMPSMGGNYREPKEKPGTGKIALNVKITDLQPEKIADWDTRHYMVEMHTVSSGCIGDSTSDIKMEVWVADIKDAHGCHEDVDYGSILGRREGGQCKITYETTGDLTEFSQIWAGLIMRQKMYDADGKLMMTREVTSLSQAKLDDGVFEIPAGYTQVSIDDYNKQRQQAMMHAMMGGGNSAGDDQGDANQGNGQNGDDQGNTGAGKKKHGFHLPGLPF